MDEDGAEVPLTAMEYDLLAVFARHPRQVLSRERLAELAHNRPLAAGRPQRRHPHHPPAPADRARPGQPRDVRTVRGEGYVFEPEA